MERFFARGRAVDLVLLVLVAEFAVLNLRPGHARARWLDRALALGPGVCMMLSLRAALTGRRWPWVAAPLAASFPLHLADVARRGL